MLVSLALIVSLAVVAWIATGLQPGVAVALGVLNVSTLALPGEDVLASASTEAGAAAGGTETALNLDAETAYAASRGMVGLAVLDRQTGIYLDNGGNAHTPMGSASVIKAVIAEELLYQRWQGQIQLGTAELDLLETMLKDSNDSAASSLYSEFGGVFLISAALDRHQLRESGPPANPRYWGNTMISAHDVVTFYSDVLSGSIPDSDRDYMFGLLHGMSPVATDGFDQLFGFAGLAPRPDAAMKQGWMCCLDNMFNVHSTAVLGPDHRYVVVIFTQYPSTFDYDFGQTTATEVARLLVEQLTL